MYGTISKMRIKPGAEAALQSTEAEFETLGVPGYIGQFVFRMDADPLEYYLVVLFADKASYAANANDPAQDARYRAYRELLTEDPEWHDGEVIASSGFSR